MFGIHDLTLFIVSGLLLNIMPGPDSLLIMARSATQGWRAGVAAALGIGAGTMVHVLAAAVGLSALLATSAAAFNVVKWVGAAYIVWCGIGMLRARLKGAPGNATLPAPAPLPYRRIFAQGFLTNVLNPKVAIFFLAFVPQFIAPETGNKALAFVLLGTLFNINSVPVNSGWALAAAWMARHGAVQRGMHRLDRAAGAMFIAFGLKLAFTDNPSR
jgi:RhtB (resistance to homoserine/threonine) family protein